MKTRIKLQPGFGGAVISLLDRFFDPQDPSGDVEAVFKLRVTADGRISLAERLEMDRWYELALRWDLPARACVADVDGERLIVTARNLS